MRNIYIYCEGQTEEAFTNEILYPYFFNMSIIVRPIVCTTKRTSTTKYTGGVQNYLKIKQELTILSKSHKNELITTMLDYYAMPKNTPNIDCDDPDIFSRMHKIEAAISSDIGQPNLFFHFNLHEFEGLLFSEPNAFSTIASSETVAKISEIRSEFPTPEYINNSYETAPSKRLEKLIPNYAKVRNGTIVSKRIGIDLLLQQCSHFSEWIQLIKYRCSS